MAEKVGTSTQYIGTLETRGKFPSSEMVHKLAAALEIDPTELFFKDLYPEAIMRNAKKIVLADIREEAGRLVSRFFDDKMRDIHDT